MNLLDSVSIAPGSKCPTVFTLEATDPDSTKCKCEQMSWPSEFYGNQPISSKVTSGTEQGRASRLKTLFPYV